MCKMLYEDRSVSAVWLYVYFLQVDEGIILYVHSILNVVYLFTLYPGF